MIKINSLIMLSFTVLIIFCFISKSHPQNENKEVKKDIQELLQTHVEENKSVGGSIGYIENGKITFYSYGRKSLDEDELLSENNIFEIGSITKVFTTLALADAISQGILQLDDPIEIHLPNVKIPEAGGKKITFRHLATHTSGLPVMPANFDHSNPKDPYASYTVEDFFNFLSQYELTTIPGESFQYSNMGMGLLGYILCKKSGKTYEELIRSLVLDKLEMNSTGIDLTPEMKSRLAYGHYIKQPLKYPDAGKDFWASDYFAGSGAMKSSIKDMTKFLAVNMGLTDSSLATLLQFCHQGLFQISPDFFMGLGWRTLHSGNNDLIYSIGGTYGFRSFIGVTRNMNKGVVIICNSREDWAETMHWVEKLGMLLLDDSEIP